MTILNLNKYKVDREKAICEMVLAGATYQEAAEHAEITRERVRQIIKKNPEYYILIQGMIYSVCPVCKIKKREVKKRKHHDKMCHTCYKKEERKRIEQDKKRWTKKYEACIDCGTTEKPHHSHGRCTKCAQKHKYDDPEYRESHRKAVKRYYYKNIDRFKEYNKKYYARTRERNTKKDN